MSDLAALFLILGAIALGAMSPGPSVIYVSRLAAADSRRSALGAALGMGLGSTVFAIVATLGLGTVLHYAGWAFLGLKLLGGVYLLYLGVRMFLHAGRSAAEGSVAVATSMRRAVLPAALAQVSNPKAIVVYSSVFAALLPASTPLWMLIVLPLAVFAVETSWYVVVALAFSTRRPRELYARFARAIDRAAGATLGALGAYFAADATRSALN
jgi:threonine/homoserine/homoserine lactone efflux protein